MFSRCISRCEWTTKALHWEMCFINNINYLLRWCRILDVKYLTLFLLSNLLSMNYSNKLYLYIKKLKTRIKTIFLWYYNFHLQFYTRTHKLKWLFRIKKTNFNAVFKLLDLLSQIIIKFGKTKHRNMPFKAKNSSPHDTNFET